jgi:diguanylate cyclase (GGDEF)-like protein/PAS domain S-box-containing protein
VSAYSVEKTNAGLDHDFEYRMIAADGRSVWLRDNVRVIAGENGPERLQGFMFDITSRKVAEQALRESEEKYRDIFNNAQVGLWRARVSDGKVMECNDRLALMYGYRDRQEAITKFISAEHYLDEGTRERMVTIVKETGEVKNFEARMSRQDGTEIWVRYSATYYPDKGYLEGVVTDISDEKSANEKLKASEKELTNILSSMQDTYYRTDKNGYIVRASSSVKDLLGYSEQEILGKKMADFYADPVGREQFLESLVSTGGKVRNYEAQLKREDGTLVWVSTNAQYYFDQQGNVAGVEGTTRDVTDRRLAEARMRMLSSALEQTADSVIVTDCDGVIEYVNPAFFHITGYTKEEAIGRRVSILKSNQHERSFYERLWNTILSGDVFQDVFINCKKDGSLFYEEKTITPIKDEHGNITHYVATGKDISERMQTQERLRYLAHHDVLTALPNRALFTDRLEHALARTKHVNKTVALLFLDLDRFKIINDTLGHDVGDGVLKTLSKRLLSCVRKSDTVARLGGDEFALVLEDVSSPDNVVQIARKIISALSSPFEVDERELFITTSIGISMYPADGKDPQTLLKHADTAMYQAKELGRNTYRFYSSDMSIRVFERLSMETSLRHALERQEFVLYYQPQVNIESGKIQGVEALLRWQHPEMGLVLPGDFVPILEETGLILAVGEWVLKTACAQAKAWHEAGFPGLRMAVNLSSRQFNAPGLIKMLTRILTQTGLNPRDLELEITESILVQHSKDTMAIFKTFSDLGVNLAIDDFGTGYSSLSYLKRFSVDTLKIDRTFIADVIHDPEDAAIVEAIIAMARRLGISVIAEGVESEAQVKFLSKQGCNQIQGFLVSQPLPAEEIYKFFPQVQEVEQV